MSDRKCCWLQAKSTDPLTPCGAVAEWEITGSKTPLEPVDACTRHVGDLLDDSPYSTVSQIYE